MSEEFDLSRYKKAQDQDYEVALKEMKEGYKRSHWMWYIFPQIIGLGQSRTSIYYSIKNLDEARAYMADETLGAHMLEICEALYASGQTDATHVFGTPDDMKFRSSLTLFKQACPEQEIFGKLLDRFFEGKEDPRTLECISWRNE